MKLFSQRIKESVATDTNPGNDIKRLGVTNHYTPIDNIITNVRNLFACHQGFVVDKGEDEVSLKLHSTQFVTKEAISKVIYNTEIMRGTCVANYIQQQGLNMIKLINVGQYWIVYFCPTDIAQSQTPNPKAGETAPQVASKVAECKELTESLLFEAEMDTIFEADDDEEMADVTKEKLKEILQMGDKVRAAKQLELLVGQQMELPREYYFAGVKSKNGDESIALRWKYQKRTGKGKTAEIIKTLINIYDDDKDGIFVPDYDEDSIVELPDEVKSLIDNVLDFLGAEKTKDPAEFSLSDEMLSDDSDNKNDEGDDNSDTNDDDNSDNNDDKSKEDEEPTDDKSKDDKDPLATDDKDDEGSEDDKRKKKKKKKSEEDDDDDDLLK